MKNVINKMIKNNLAQSIEDINYIIDNDKAKNLSHRRRLLLAVKDIRNALKKLNIEDNKNV